MSLEKSGRLGSAPLVYTVAMVRFENQQIGDEQISKIRAALEPGFPRFDDNILEVASVQMGAETKVVGQQITEWHGESFNQDAGFLLRNDGLFVQTLNYIDHEHFEEMLGRVLSTVQESLGFQYYQAVGIRYLDAIYRGGLQSIEEYVESSLLGFRVRSDHYSQQQSIYETTARNGDLAIRLRCARMPDSVVPIPTDLHPLMGYLGKDKISSHEQKGEDCLFLDTDCFMAEMELRPFELSEVLKQLNEMHEESATIFKSVVTDKAWKEWKPIKG